MEDFGPDTREDDSDAAELGAERYLRTIDVLTRVAADNTTADDLMFLVIELGVQPKHLEDAIRAKAAR